MKKVITMMAIGVIAGSAFADLTGWKWDAGASILDQNGAGIANAAGSVFTIPGVDLGLLVVGDEIQLSFIKAVGLSFVEGLSVVPFGPTIGQWGSAGNNAYDGSITGLGAYAMVVNRAGLTSLDDIVDGDYVGFTSLAGTFIDLQPNTNLPAAAAQKFDGGALETSVKVIPEPATFGMMGVAALGLFLARKKAHR